MGRKEMIEQVQRDLAQRRAEQDAQRNALREQVLRDLAQRRAAAR